MRWLRNLLGRRRVGRWRTWLAAAAIAGALGWAIWWWATRPPPGVSREVAGLVRDLGRQPAMYQRWTTAGATRLHRGARRFLPAFLLTDTVELKRLEACHRLVALGPGARPLAPQLVRTFASRDPTTSFYAFVVLVHSTVSAPTVVALAREAWGSGTGPAHFYAGLLGTEDERIRDFAWQCLEAAGNDALAVVNQLKSLAAEGEPELRLRAGKLLQRLGVATNQVPASAAGR